MKEDKKYSAPMLVAGADGQLKVARVKAPSRSK